MHREVDLQPSVSDDGDSINHLPPESARGRYEGSPRAADERPREPRTFNELAGTHSDAVHGNPG